MTAPPIRRPVRPPAWLVQVALLALGVLVFSRLHDLVGTDVVAATRHARTVQSVERSVGLDIEHGWNHWLAGHDVAIRAAVLYYRLYYLVVAAVLIGLIVRRPDVYRVVRRVLLVVAVLALVVFWLFPTSPPRFAMPGIVDIVARHDLFGSRASVDMTNGQNHFSAMPSLHVGWSAVTAYAAWLVLHGRHRWAALLVWAFPAGMVLVVIATGNHYVLDVVGSVVLLGVAVVLVRLLPASEAGGEGGRGGGHPGDQERTADAERRDDRTTGEHPER